MTTTGCDVCEGPDGPLMTMSLTADGVSAVEVGMCRECGVGLMVWLAQRSQAATAQAAAEVAEVKQWLGIP